MGAITLRWVESNLMVGTDSLGHSIVIGKSPEDKTFIGFKPSDLLLMAAASCTMYDVTEILIKQREPLEDLKITCSGEQLAEPPYTFTRIHLQYAVKGAVNPVKLEKAIRLSEDKYCSVLSTLRLAIPITSAYEIL